MKKKLIVALLFLVAFSMVSCVSEVEEELIPSAGGGGTTTCNTDDVTFSGTVQPLIKGNCLPCHSAANRSGGVSLDGYNNIRSVAQSGALVGVITHSVGYSPMPQGRAKLPSCDIESIKKWIADGTPQN